MVRSQANRTGQKRKARGRQAMTSVKWKCPICNGKNSDEYEKDELLMCTHCESEASWTDVLTDQEIEKLDRES